jgi:hypothetical protein
MRKLQSLVAVPHKDKTAPHKRILFGQLLVGHENAGLPKGFAYDAAKGLMVPTERKIPHLDFAKEAANAVLIQAEMNGVCLDYSPNGEQFVTRKEGNENILEFEGDLPAYLKLPGSDAFSLNVSFREAEEGDKTQDVKEKAKLTPSYVLTLSAEATNTGEFFKEDFWGQIGNNLFCGLSEPDPERGREGHPDLKIAIVFGSEDAYFVIPNKL